jgi:hypothetical protein
MNSDEEYFNCFRLPRIFWNILEYSETYSTDTKKKHSNFDRLPVPVVLLGVVGVLLTWTSRL